MKCIVFKLCWSVQRNYLELLSKCLPSFLSPAVSNRESKVLEIKGSKWVTLICGILYNKSEHRYADFTSFPVSQAFSLTISLSSSSAIKIRKKGAGGGHDFKLMG